MEVIQTAIEGVVIIEPRLFNDDRGYFFESFSQRDFEKQVRTVRFVQDNESKSSYGVLRGLHFQKPPFAQSKLVRVIRGAVLDVAVDIRKGSPTFGRHVAVELTEDNHRQFFIPRGFAHGFSVLTPEVVFQYKCDNFYAPQSEGALAWDDPDLGIDWRIPADRVILSEKDKHHPRLKEVVRTLRRGGKPSDYGEDEPHIRRKEALLRGLIPLLDAPQKLLALPSGKPRERARVYAADDDFAHKNILLHIVM